MSFSVPTSPAMTRSSKAQPVTPQRLPRQQPRSQSFYRSPLTPSASPYTPISLRSLDSTNSSTLTTPDNLGSGLKKRLNFNGGSPDVLRNVSAAQDKSLADIADNWRSRANENGIKVAFASQNESSYVADDSSDMSLSDVAPDSSTISNGEALFGAPLVPTHRRMNSLPVINRPRAQSQASLPPTRMHPLSPVTSRTNNRPLQMASPLQPRRSGSSVGHVTSIMSTPPPNRALASKLRLKGSLTDPAQPRRRETFGHLSTPSANIANRNASFTLEPDTSLDLFDIDENDFDYENDCQGGELDNSFSRNLEALHSNNLGYPLFSQQLQQVQQPVFNQQHFADPFQPMARFNGLHRSAHILQGIPEGPEHHYFPAPQQHARKTYYDDVHNPHYGFYPPVGRLQNQYAQPMAQNYPAFISVPQPAALPYQNTAPMQPKACADRSFASSTSKASSPESSPSDCSVCLASNPVSLAILQPCGHPLCSACLTSALNIVGEKDMQCAVCKQSVADFKLVMGSSKAEKSVSGNSPGQNKADLAKSFDNEVYQDAADTSIDGLESAFEFGLDFGDLRASTPKLEQQIEHSQSFNQVGARKSEDNVVLRIDNVPWDITPVQITKWLQQPVERVHVLLDGKGKTLSHAYVEVSNASIAGAILRGEALSPNAQGKKERGSVLGRGRRARGVTVTRSGQQELMADLFPHWRGSFDGCRPSLAGLEGDRIIGALESGLLTEQEISGLLFLIREPDSHFLKVPSLPFHSLISILSKFPADVDSRVFWSSNVRDSLFDATYTAIQVLVQRVEKATQNSKSGQDEEYTTDLVVALSHTAMECQAFTAQQVHKLYEQARSYSLPLPESNAMSAAGSATPFVSGNRSVLKTPPNQDMSAVIYNQRSVYHNQVKDDSNGSLDDLAREFGVDAQVVQALAQRLAKGAY
ncbi:hypothetical protein D9613_008773 [Agrocybe pediades]|uniref:RING-type domain-containing protein n=1 Tax=Agrocybe pediades TaxID=84607 RepID=A0A8H4QSH6_9AGAR|nr:hypothetical protein D9613_008773 [Agrocybe pediades]